MKNKFHWGHGITIFFIMFVTTLVFILIASRQQDHSLVRSDYYALDLAYQDRYDAIKSAKTSDLKIDYQKEEAKLILNFGSSQMPEGEILFYRPSDQSMDFNVAIDKSEMIVDTEKLYPGLWKMKIKWTYQGQNYYQEEKIYI